MRVGGQAIMEGVLMRSPNFWGMAVRTPTGDMDVQAEPFNSITKKSKLFRLPIIRGFLSLAEPVLGTKGVGWLIGNSIDNPILFNLVEGAIRIGIFMLYLVGITAVSKDIKRFFAYHGAEHKAIKVYERGEELVPENARKLDTSHVRCGTSFVLYVLVLSILVFSLLGVEGWVYMLASRVIVI